MTETGLAKLFRRAGALAAAALATAVAVAGTVAPACAQPADGQPAVFIVLDASGSMAAPIANTRLPKIGLAREAIARGLARIPPDTRLGVAAFGHRKGDCGDIEILRPAEAIDAQRIGQGLERVSPRGRGPLTQALRLAARELPQSKGPRSLILIHDDADNCTVDLCALAAELGKANIKVHAIGLALKAEDRPRMACLPQLTGGKLYLAMTPEQVGAAVEEALQLASAGALPKPAPAVAVEGAEADAIVPDTAPPGLYLRARLAAQSQGLVLQPLRWTVTPDGENRTPLYAEAAVNPYLPLPAGKYIVEARDGPARASATVLVSETKPTLLVMPLDAGSLRARALTGRGTPFPGSTISIAKASGAEPSPNAPLGEITGAFVGWDGALLLPAGRYVVRAEAGLARVQKAIDITPGANAALDLVLDAGLVQLTAANTSPQQPAVFVVLEDDPDAPRGRREVLRTAQRSPEIALPPGTYTVELRQSGVEVRERIVIAAGETLRRTLTLVAGQVALATRAGTQMLADQVFYSIERIDGAGSDVPTTTSRPQPTLLLAAGRYRIESRFGAINARASREVEVRAGAPVQQIVFDQTAGNVRLRAQNPPGEVFWDVRDARGQPVWSTGQPEPDLTLQAGQYIVRAFARDRQVEKPLDLRAGDRKSLDVSFE